MRNSVKQIAYAQNKVRAFTTKKVNYASSICFKLKYKYVNYDADGANTQQVEANPAERHDAVTHGLNY